MRKDVGLDKVYYFECNFDTIYDIFFIKKNYHFST